jgi:tetratricopeptide (TPR) repeat protein
MQQKGDASPAQENYSKALELLQAAVQQYQTTDASVPPDVYEHLAMVQEALGQKDRAIDSYNQALQTGKAAISEQTKKRLQDAIERLSN